MKTPIILIAAAAILSGCASTPYNQYGYRGDPSQWHTVSVTPVPAGTGDRIAAASPNGSRVEYSSQPIVVAPQPVYVQQPYYSAPHLYTEPSYYYPPVSLSLGFVFGQHWGSGRHYRGRGHR